MEQTAVRNSRYNPYAFPRRVRFDEVAGGLALFRSKSFTSPDPEDRYQPVVDVETGAVSCDCGHFEHRLAKLEPTAASPTAHLCKHLKRAVPR